jgi:hypothetical protein
MSGIVGAVLKLAETAAVELVGDGTAVLTKTIKSMTGKRLDIVVAVQIKTRDKEEVDTSWVQSRLSQSSQD